MNLSGSNFHMLLLKQFVKQLQVPKAHAFTRRNVSQFRKPVVFDGRGGDMTVRRKQLVNLAFLDNQSNGILSSGLYRCFGGCWRNRISFVGFHTTAGNCHGEYEWQDPKSEEEVVNVQVVGKDGKLHNVRGKIGDNLLYLSKRFEVEMEGACEASLACTTCHVYVDHDFLDLLPEATETEEDLLDQAPFLKENSRLGCQIILNKQLNGIKLALPSATKNFYVDGHKPTPH